MHTDWAPDHPALDTDAPLPLHQSRPYAAAMRLLGCAVQSCIVSNGSTPLARALVVRPNRRFLHPVALLPQGPLWLGTPSADTATRALLAIARTTPFGRLALITNAPSAGDDRFFHRAGHLRLRNGQPRATLDLCGDAQTRLARQSAKWRNRLRHAQQADLQISHAPFPPDPAHWLLKAEAAQRRLRGYLALPAVFALAYAQANPEGTILFTARHKGAPVAAMLFLLHAPCASYHIGWTAAQGRKLSAHNLLLHSAVNWLAARGYRQLDLGTADPLQTAGLARFKLGAGGRTQLGGCTWVTSRASSALLRALR